jgi:uncharacterized OB-fold protein
MVDYPLPQVTDLTRPFWSALDQGHLAFQRCGACRHAWLPARPECPGCLASDAKWEKASGRGRVVSWVVYHSAYHDAFKDRLPYVVAIVALDEGPRLISNFVGPRNALRIDLPVSLVIEREQGFALARFGLPA